MISLVAESASPKKTENQRETAQRFYKSTRGVLLLLLSLLSLPSVPDASLHFSFLLYTLD